MPTGDDLKKIIGIEFGGNITAASKKMGISRATLYSYTNKAVLDKSIVQFVNTKLDTKLPEEDTGNSDVNAKYIALLEKNLHERDSEIASLKGDLAEIKIKLDGLSSVKDMAEKNAANLSDVLKNQLTAQAMDYALRKTLADFVAKQLDQDPKSILRTLHKDAADKMKGLSRKGNILEIDT